ncbi:condensation domain-containing protein [Micromonospora sp. CPCC 205561]|uniref:condensation domain-containing protein n=1 Tax=Micromonospora sp. CPCC 205561 TaxID=3122407 RepID=UPI002FEF7349
MNAGDGDARELSVGQAAQWALYRLAPESSTSNVVTAVLAEPALDTDALRAALVAVQERHDLLRSRFAETEAGPVRLVDGAGSGAVELRDVGDVDDAALRDLVRAVGEQPLRLEHDGPLRAVLLRRRTDCALVLVIHHIATDGLSQWLIWRDLGEAYRAARGGGSVRWPSLPRYDEFVARERALLAGPRRAELAEHWERACAGATAATLPTDRPRPAHRSYRGAAVARMLPDEVVRAVRATAAALGVTPFSVLLGVFEALLHRCTGQREFTIGCPVSLRRGRALREVVGMLVNPVVLRSSFEPETTFAAAIAAAGRQLTEGVARAAYPFALVQAARRDRDPLVRVTITLLTRQHGDTLSDTSNGFVGHRVRQLVVPYDEGQFDLAVTIHQLPDLSLRTEFNYDTDLLDRATVERLFDQYLALLGAACAEPGATVADAPLVGDAERRMLLELGMS